MIDGQSESRSFYVVDTYLGSTLDAHYEKLKELLTPAASAISKQKQMDVVNAVMRERTSDQQVTIATKYVAPPGFPQNERSFRYII